MRPRLNLWLKKRGGRRTGSQRSAVSGEVLYHSVFIGVGLVAAWLHVTSVLLPEWARRSRLAGYKPAQCEVVDTRVTARRGVAAAVEYLPQCEVRLDRDGGLSPSVLANAGAPTTSHRRAERQLADWTKGSRVDCWFDPDDPSRVVMSRSIHWWPAIVLSIPISLVVLGVVGVVRAMLRGGASEEFRHVVTQTALGARAYRPGSPPAVSGLPASEPIGDSPGTRLSFRLPRESSDGWRTAGMLLICLAWNALVGFFLYGVVHAHATGAPDWAVTLVITPLAVAGGWLAYQMLRDARGVTGVGVTRLELSDHPLRPGGSYRGVLVQEGQFAARKLSVALVCEEVAIYRQGTDTRRSTEEVQRRVLLSESRVKIEASAPLERGFDFTLPEGAMHSFRSTHNEVAWRLEVAGSPVKWPRFRRRFQVCVYPIGWPEVDPVPLAAAGAGDAGNGDAVPGTGVVA